MNSVDILFYLIKPGTKIEARYGGNDSTGKYIKGSVFINVKKPQCTVAIPTFGPMSGSQGDIKFPVAFMPSSTTVSYGGKYNWVQVLRTYDVTKVIFGVPISSSLSSTSTLDTQYPYNVSAAPANVISYQELDDLPEVSNLSASSIYFKFKATAYLMWLPPQSGSIPVPVATIDWNFTGDVEGIKLVTNQSGNSGPDYSVVNEPTWDDIRNK